MTKWIQILLYSQFLLFGPVFSILSAYPPYQLLVFLLGAYSHSPISVLW